EDITGASGYRVAQKGMVRTFQLTKALSRLTVLENMKLGATGQSGERFLTALVRPRWRDQERRITEKADELLERFMLAHMREEFAGSLSGGQRKLLEMARALMSDPKLIMLDEPMAGVNPALAQTIITHVKTLADDGLTVLFVEHDMDVVRTISDWVVVMAEGEIVAEGRHSAIVANPRVIDAYLGAHHATPLDRAEQDRQLAQAAEELSRTEEP
ncbi:MAG TPA: ATP-binding cassette domain-containing protein, partial [Acidimicrobiales bacterium]|nr:ATP-binding cassette domain-containing protein [Acidimicrobiales bacterium]